MRNRKNPLLLGLGVLALAGILLSGCSYNPAAQPAPTAPADAGDQADEDDGGDGVG